MDGRDARLDSSVLPDRVEPLKSRDCFAKIAYLTEAMRALADFLRGEAGPSRTQPALHSLFWNY